MERGVEETLVATKYSLATFEVGEEGVFHSPVSFHRGSAATPIIDCPFGCAWRQPAQSRAATVP